MAHEILAGKEMGCLASKVEMANDEHAALSAFWRCLEDDTETSQLEINTATNNEEDLFEDEAAQHLNHFYEVLGDGSVDTLEKGTVPAFSLLNSSKVSLSCWSWF